MRTVMMSRSANFAHRCRPTTGVDVNAVQPSRSSMIVTWIAAFLTVICSSNIGLGINEPDIQQLVESQNSEETQANGQVQKFPSLQLNYNSIDISSRDSRRQLIAMTKDASQASIDVTREAKWIVEPPELARLDADGLLIPLQAGSGQVIVQWGDASYSVPLQIQFPAQEPQVNFPNQVVPVFTKHGCNGGGCHGKISGQNGFRLSLLGFEPTEDYEYLVREGRGRRLFPAAPDSSLLLLKSIGIVPHGGGKRMDADSDDYRTLRRWIAQAMPYGDPEDRKVTEIEVIPSASRLHRGATQQLSVIATFIDGRKEDITRTVQYESNNLDMADVSAQGLVQLNDLAGEVSIMARYQGKVGVFRASIPIGVEKTAPLQPANSIDAAVFAKWESLGLPPSERCDDSTFLRRVTLDIAGRLPTLQEIETSQNMSRAQIIDNLLESDDYSNFFASKWSAVLRNKIASPGSKFGAIAFHNWLVDSLQENIAYDELVTNIVTASGSIQNDPALVWYRQVGETEARIEDLSQLFLGQRLQCARCHHHPFEKWGQQDYAQMAAFFSKVERRGGDLGEEVRFVSRIGNATTPHPKTQQPLPPAGLESPPAELTAVADPREALAAWMTSPENPFFAKSLVNRYWKHFFGKGLVEPEDDLRVTNPPSNPELMDALEKDFITSGYDLKQLIRAICNSETYQRSSLANESNLIDRNCYSRFYPKRLQAEVLLDAIDEVLGIHSKFDGLPAGTRAVELPSTSFASYFLTVFGRPESSTACECERTTESNLAQSLHLMNSLEIHEKLTAPENRISDWVAKLQTAIHPTDHQTDDPKSESRATLSEQAEIEAKKVVSELYELAFSRQPSSQELTVAVTYILDTKEPLRDRLEDLVWSVLNSKEFLFNH